jgi:hypothetical protein
MEVSGQLHAPPLYPQEESPWYPLDRRLGGPTEQNHNFLTNNKSCENMAKFNYMVTTVTN